MSSQDFCKAVMSQLYSHHPQPPEYIRSYKNTGRTNMKTQWAGLAQAHGSWPIIADGAFQEQELELSDFGIIYT